MMNNQTMFSVVVVSMYHHLCHCLSTRVCGGVRVVDEKKNEKELQKNKKNTNMKKLEKRKNEIWGLVAGYQPHVFFCFLFMKNGDGGERCTLVYVFQE